MAELATIARPYAEALFQASTAPDPSSGDLAGALVWVEELGVITADPALRRIADDPKVTPQQVFDVIVAVVRTPLPETGRNFLRTVIDNGRLEALPEVATQFRARVNTLGGSSDAIVYSAFPIEGAALAELGTSLEKRFGRKLNLTVQPDDALIAGVRVVVGDEVLDTSVKARLEQLKAALTA